MKKVKICLYCFSITICLLIGLFFKLKLSSLSATAQSQHASSYKYGESGEPDYMEAPQINTDEKQDSAEQNMPVQNAGLAFDYENLFAYTQDYPQYYTSEIEDSVDSMTQLVTTDSLNYIFMTDLHIDNSVFNTLSIIRQLKAAVNIANHSPIDFICIGGDLYNGNCFNGAGEAAETIQQITDVLKDSEKPVFILHGNHDDNSFTAQFDQSLLGSPDYIMTEDEWYQATMANFSQYATDYHSGYYYYDLPDKNVRVVALNMNDFGDTLDDEGRFARIGYNNYEYSDEQIQWLLNSALSRSDYDYIILSHDGFDYQSGYDSTSNREVLKMILTAAVNKTYFTYGSFRKDFRNWDPQILLYNCGHLHQERLTATQTINGLPILNTDTASISRTDTSAEYAALGYSRFSDRSFGTIKEACFDIVIRNKASVNVIRFGGGSDLTLSLP